MLCVYNKPLKSNDQLLILNSANKPLILEGNTRLIVRTTETETLLQTHCSSRQFDSTRVTEYSLERVYE